MSNLQEIAFEALKAAHTDFVKARRFLLMAAGLLALIHLLTVYPYVTASREIAGLERSMAANAALLARVDPEIKRLQEAERISGKRLDKLLSAATDEMIRHFQDLRPMVQSALLGESLDVGPSPSSTIQSNAPPLGDISESDVYWQELEPVLQAIADDEPDAHLQMAAYARKHIVGPAYAQAQFVWNKDIRPAYLSALDATEEAARREAQDAPESAAETAAALDAAADELANQRAAIEKIEISHNNTVDEALGSDWWRTIGGKIEYASAVRSSIGRQMDRITESASAPYTATRKILVLQKELRDNLKSRQKQLEKQFDEQREQLAALSGVTSVMPVDLANFINMFPLVLGLVLALALLRIGQARHEAALAAADPALAVPEYKKSRAWLARRALGGDNALSPLVVTGMLALGSMLWIALATLQVADSPMTPPLAPWTSGALAALFIFAAAIWDAVAIRRLAAGLQH